MKYSVAVETMQLVDVEACSEEQALKIVKEQLEA